MKEHEVAKKLGTKHKTTSKFQETKVRQNQTYSKKDVGSGCSFSKQGETPTIQNQTSMVNRTTGLKSNVTHNVNIDKQKWLGQNTPNNVKQKKF